MDPKLIYWTAAWLNMLVIMGLAWSGIRRIRRGQVAAHRRRMLGAASLVAAFLGSYLLKLFFLGREQLGLWDPLYVTVLRVHELCILVMVVAGGTALGLALRLRLAEARDGSRAPGDPARLPARLRLHRRAGRSAVAAVVAGLLTAGVVLYGMYARAGPA